MKLSKNLPFVTLLALGLGLASAGSARAQFSGDNLKGDNGLQSGTQPPPGLYLVTSYYHYGSDSLRNSSGDAIALDPQQRSNIAANGFFMPTLLWVSKAKFLGAEYGALVAPGWINRATEVPVLGLDQQSNTKFTDLYVQPVRLGWHRARSDFLVGLGLYAPTGDYQFRGDSNSGFGMWGFEVSAGTTLYFDEKKNWHFATTAYYETHTKKKDTEIKVGDILTLEGGLGRSFLGGGAKVGVAYYAQWKLTSDDLNILPPGFPRPEASRIGKNRVYAAGPELSAPIATKKKVYAFADVRYLWEFGAQTTLQGHTLFATLTVPLPSIAIK